MTKKIIYTDLKVPFILMQIFFSGPFIIGIFLTKGVSSISSSLCCNMMLLILICMYYKNIKKKKNLTGYSFITLFMYTSIVFCFAVYCTFYNVSELINRSLQNKVQNTELVRDILSISSNTIYVLITIILVTHFQDLVFSITLEYILIAYLLGDKLSHAQLISTIVLISFNALVILFTLCKYKSTAFGYEADTEMNEILEARLRHNNHHKFSLI